MKNKWNICNSHYLGIVKSLLTRNKEWYLDTTWTKYDSVIFKVERFFESIYRIPEVLAFYKEYGSCPSKGFATLCNLRGCYDFVMGNIESRWFSIFEDFECSANLLEQVKPTRESILSGDEEVIKELDFLFHGWGLDPKDDIDFIDWIVENYCEEGLESFYYCG